MQKPILSFYVLVIAVALSLAQATPRTQLRSFPQLAAQADTARDSNQLPLAETLYRQALAEKPSWAEGWWSLGTIL